MDGVLINSSPIHAAAYQEALRGLPVVNFVYSRVAGMRSRDGIRAVLQENRIDLPDDRVAALAEAKSRIALERIVAENPLFPNALTILGKLARRSRLALATSASQPAVNAFLDRNGLRGVFQSVVHSGDVQNAKPFPDIFESAIQGLGVNPADALVVEDAVAGIQAAKAAGAVACGIPTTCSAEELQRAGADLMIDDLEDLLELGARS